MALQSKLRKIIKHQFLKLYTLSPTIIFWFAKRNIINTYQPIWQHQTSKANRSCEDRWKKIQPLLPDTAFSFLDIGAQIGYFTLSAANAGALSIGIERDPYFVAMANSQAIYNKIQRISFIKMDITPDIIELLPRVNVTCCLSVFHHWVREYEFSGADKIFSKICENTDSIFFETGQSNEPVPEWQHKLSFMGDLPETWIETYLKEKGFTTVKQLGKFPTHLTNIDRTLYYATK